MLSSFMLKHFNFAESYDMSIIESASIGEIVGVVLADDIDVGKNAEITYSIEERGGHFSMFNIITDNITQEGIVTLNKVSVSLNGFCHFTCKCKSTAMLIPS